jgi:hypothetical protein
MIDNPAKDASNFPSPEEQITFQLKSQKLQERASRVTCTQTSERQSLGDNTAE